MKISILFVCTCLFIFLLSLIVWLSKERRYKSSLTVSSAYDAWTKDQILEELWGEHIHLGFYKSSSKKNNFRDAKVELVHQLVRWSGLDKLPVGSRVLDVGCGIGGSSRILAEQYGFNVVGVSISSLQVERARALTPKAISCRFMVMNALDLKFDKGSFDGVWSVEAGPHMPNKQTYADEMLRVLRPGGVLAVADWNCRELSNKPMTKIENLVMKQLLNQWAHPEFATINGFKNNLLNSRFSGGSVVTDDWTLMTKPSWMDSIFEGFRRPFALLKLGPLSLFKSFREIPTIILMHWSFSNGLMRFGVFKCRG